MVDAHDSGGDDHLLALFNPREVRARVHNRGHVDPYTEFPLDVRVPSVHSADSVRPCVDVARLHAAGDVLAHVCG